MPVPGWGGFMIGEARYYWEKYHLYREQFKEKPTEIILAIMEARGIVEKINSYNPFSWANARKKAARNTLRERIEEE